jgi:hypothetical protein
METETKTETNRDEDGDGDGDGERAFLCSGLTQGILLPMQKDEREKLMYAWVAGWSLKRTNTNP